MRDKEKKKGLVIMIVVVIFFIIVTFLLYYLKHINSIEKSAIKQEEQREFPIYKIDHPKLEIYDFSIGRTMESYGITATIENHSKQTISKKMFTMILELSTGGVVELKFYIESLPPSKNQPIIIQSDNKKIKYTKSYQVILN